MARYGYVQLEDLWVQAGGSQRLSPVMAAIALAESGGNPKATHHNSNGSTDYGLWQINSVHHYNPQLLLSNPVYNAKAAVSIEKGSGLGAWSSFNNGSYKKFLNVGSGLPYNPNDSKVGRIDEGVDITSGSPFTAVASGRVVHIDPNFYNGTPAVYIKLDHPVQVGNNTYPGVYYAETRALVHVGQHVQAGQNIIGPGNAEIGFAKPFGSSAASWLPAAHANYHEGQQTQAGADFAATIKVGSGGGGGFWSAVSGIPGDVNSVIRHVPGVAQVEGVAGGVSDVAGFLAKLTDPNFWLRAAEVIGGGILAILGIYLLARQVGLAAADATPQPIVDLAKAVPETRAAGVALEGVRQQRQAKRNEREYRAGQSEGQRRASRSEGVKAGKASISSQGVSRGRRKSVSPPSEAGTRRAAIKSRAARSSDPASNEIPF